MTTAEKIAAEEKSGSSSGADRMQVPVVQVPDKRKALGRGLDSLLAARPRVVPPIAPATSIVPSNVAPANGTLHVPAHAPHQAAGDGLLQIPLDQIDENPYQTRRQFSEVALAELAESIRATGLIQPIIVRPGAHGRYVLVLGERRCRASKLAGKATVPGIVRNVSEQQAAEMTIVENLQRQDLNCLEQANAFSRLSREFGLTQEQIGQRTGVSRESVSNYMRLLKLPEAVQQYVADGSIGFSEARVLLQLTDPAQIALIAEEAVQKHLSVASLQALVENVNLPKDDQPTRSRERLVDPNVRAAQSELQRVLGVRVKINDRKGKGKIVIEYANLEDFDRVLDMLKGKA